MVKGPFFHFESQVFNSFIKKFDVHVHVYTVKHKITLYMYWVIFDPFDFCPSTLANHFAQF